MRGAEARLLRKTQTLDGILSRWTPHHVSHANRAAEASYLQSSAPEADQGNPRLRNKDGVIRLYGQAILQ